MATSIKRAHSSKGLVHGETLGKIVFGGSLLLTVYLIFRAHQYHYSPQLVMGLSTVIIFSNLHFNKRRYLIIFNLTAVTLISATLLISDTLVTAETKLFFLAFLLFSSFTSLFMAFYRLVMERKLRESEFRYRQLFETSQDGIAFTDLSGKIRYCNQAYANLYGYASSQLSNKDFEKLIPHLYTNAQSTLIKQDQGLDDYREYHKAYEDDQGNKLEFSERTWLRQDSENIPVGKWVTVRDITEQKRIEREIQYLSFHDKLTNLYNRAYFEEELRRLDTNRQLPLSVIIGDVNGLKLVNDAFGHTEGDNLLEVVSKLLRDTFRKEDIIARWGGDEFAVLLPRTDRKTVNKLIRRIKNRSRSLRNKIPVSVALGAATKEAESDSMIDHVRAAEELMYKNKLRESKDVRSSIIASVRESMFINTNETPEHIERVQHMAEQLGTSLGLPQPQLDKLKLLASLHDTGKIAVSEEIINKAGQLSLDEWGEVKKHPEVGYRIAIASPELAPIAEGILSHHERWDGRGYPRGLKKDQIPLSARIIAVVDAYDTMVSGTIYQVALSPQEALAELKRCAGSQFDPGLVALFAEII